MANDIEIKIGIDDSGLAKHFKGLSKAIKAFTKNVKTLSTAQKKLSKTEKTGNEESKEKLKLSKFLESSAKKRVAIDLKQIAVQTKLNNAAASTKGADARKANALSFKLESNERKKSNKLLKEDIILRSKVAAADARKSNVLHLKKETAERQKSLASLKADIIARSASDAKIRRNTKSLNLNATALNRVYKGMIDISTKGRLVNNSFATLRSKLLLASFAFGLVGAAITRNIKAFAEQQEAVARLALQFGSAASKELSEYAASLQQVTRFGDELIIGMMSQFGAFGATIDQTKALTEATLDLAEGQGMDLNSAAQLVAKSFGSSTNALARYGIEISKNSSKQEKINQIITQSQQKFGGLSKLLGSMSGSSIKKLSNAFGDLTERFGEVLAEGITPLVSGLQKMTDAMGTTGIRILIEAVTSLAIAYASLKTIAFGAGMFKAVGLATRKLRMVKAVTLGAGRAALTAAASTRVFTAALAGSTGGISLLVGGAVTLGIMLLEWSGLFKKTTEETEASDKELNKYHESIQGFNTEKGMGQLDNFYKKLVEGNQLLILANNSFKENLLPDLLNVYAHVDKNKLLADANALVSIIAGVNQKIEDDSKTHGERRNKIREEIRSKNQKKRLKGWDENDKQLVAALKQELATLSVHKDNLKSQRKTLMKELSGINSTFIMVDEGKEVKSKFIELTGVTGAFFDDYIANSGLMESINSGLIDSNQGLVDVVDVIIEQGGNWLELKEKQRNALIAEIILKGKNAEASKKAAEQEIKWAKMSAAQRGFLVGQTMKAGAALLSSQGKNAKEAARLNQLGAIADTYAAATTAVKNPIKMAAIIMAGLANVIKIEEALNSMSGGGGAPQFEQGGYVGGRRHSQGGTMIEAERGEFVMSRNAVESIGTETLNQMNQGGGGGNINVSVTGNVLTQDFVEGELAEAIKEAARRGSDFGLS